MSILKDVLIELFGMFVADARLTIAILCVVALTGGLIDLAGTAPLIGGVFLLAGCLGVTIAAVLWTARRKTRR